MKKYFFKGFCFKTHKRAFLGVNNIFLEFCFLLLKQKQKKKFEFFFFGAFSKILTKWTFVRLLFLGLIKAET